MTDFVPCPEPGCDLPAAIVDRSMANGAPMPVELIKVRCPMRHWFHGAADTMLGEELW